MKYVFSGSVAVLVLLSVVAALWQPRRPDDRVVLTWMSDPAPVRQEQADLFNRHSTKYRVVIDANNSGDLFKIMVQCLAGAGGDLFDIQTPNALSALVRSDIAYDCTGAFLDRGIDMAEVWPFLEPFHTLDGRVYGHPRNASAQAMWINKRLFREAGLAIPSPDWTWDEMIDVAQKLTKRDERGRPMQFGFLSAWDLGLWLPLVYQWEGTIFNEARTRSILTSPNTVEAVQFAQDLIYKYRVMPTPTEDLNLASSGGWGRGAMTLFAAGKGAMALGGRWWLLLLRAPEFADIELTALPLPKGPRRASMGYGSTVVINKYGKNIEGCLEFMRFLHSEDYNRLVNEQADGLGPVRKFTEGAYEAAFLHDPAHPHEDFNAVWRDAAVHAKATQICPYVNGYAVDANFLREEEFLRQGQKTAAQSLQDSERRINTEIVKYLRIDPVARARYEEALAQGAAPAWDSPEAAP